MNNTSSNNRFLKIVGTIGAIAGAIYYSIQVGKYISQIDFSYKIIISFSILLFITTLVFSYFILKKITTNNQSESNKFLIDKLFLIPFCLISVLNIGISSYFLGTKIELEETFQTNSKNRIALILPLNENLGSSYQDGIRQILGFAEYLKNNPEITRNIEFVLYDHNMKASDAEKIIKEEIGLGTKYFISTMSSVNLQLAENFPEIVASFELNGTKPKLICTVTSSPSLLLNSDLVYRYYIRSQEESKALALVGKEKGFSTATYIAVDNDYGKGAVSEFKNSWSGTVSDGIFIDMNLTVSDIEKEISKKILTLPPEERQAIFICHFGNGIDNSITALSNLKVNSTILATSTLSIDEWQKPIRQILDKMEWYTCIPEYQSVDKKQNDVIKNFTTYTIDKLITAIKDTSFNNSWKTFKSPNNLDAQWKDNDFIIPMKAVYKTEFNSSK
jgi:hypothetical protein